MIISTAVGIFGNGVSGYYVRKTRKYKFIILVEISGSIISFGIVTLCFVLGNWSFTYIAIGI